MHPNRVLAALREALPADAVVVADGGDFLSFARVGLPASTYLDPGSLGCIGVGTPFGIAASLACPGALVVVATGDGAFGFNAMEIDTAVRQKAPVLIVVANNGSGRSRCATSRKPTARWWARTCSSPTTRPWRAPSACTAERVERAEDLPGAIARALAELAGWPACPAGRHRHAGGGLVGRQERPGLGARPAGPGGLGHGRARVEKPPRRMNGLAM
jgi:acetolactate synthase I/II/III large subunit